MLHWILMKESLKQTEPAMEHGDGEHGCCGHSHASEELYAEHLKGDAKASASRHDHTRSGASSDGGASVQDLTPDICDTDAEHVETKRIVSFDALGIIASSICLVHCMAMPFIIAFLPFLGLQFLESPMAHKVIAACVIAFAVFAIIPGYKRHRNRLVLAALWLGLGLVIFAAFTAGILITEQMELPMITAGNLILVCTHLRNLKLCKCVH